MVFTVVVNHRVVLSGVSLAEAKRSATWLANRLPYATISVGVQ